VSSPQGRFPDATLVDGQRLRRVDAFGKHLFYEWSNGLIVHVHLGLFGRFHRYPGPGPAEAPSVRMRLSVPKTTIDLTGPTDCSIGTSEDRDRIIARLGPDPLRDDAEPEVARAKIAKRIAPIGQLLLEQTVVSGIGNVYRAEALFVNGMHPLRSGRDISDAEFEALWSTLVAMLRRGVAENRIVTVDRDEFDVPAAPRRRGETTYVYHRDVCLRCGTPIHTVELGGRPCYYCPTCQPS
jgi:endonuclease-8